MFCGLVQPLFVAEMLIAKGCFLIDCFRVVLYELVARRRWDTVGRPCRHQTRGSNFGSHWQLRAPEMALPCDEIHLCNR